MLTVVKYCFNKREVLIDVKGVVAIKQSLITNKRRMSGLWMQTFSIKEYITGKVWRGVVCSRFINKLLGISIFSKYCFVDKAIKFLTNDIPFFFFILKNSQTWEGLIAYYTIDDCIPEQSDYPP